MKPDELVGFVFIQGAGLDRSIWQPVTNGLEIPYLLVDFPARQLSGREHNRLSLRDYATSIGQQIAKWEVEKFVLVAHSLGGVLAMELAEKLGDRIVGAVAIGAAVPQPGQSFLSVLPVAKRLALHVLLRIAGTKPPEKAIRKGLCKELPEEQAAEIVQRFSSESVRLYTDRVEANLPEVPKLYIKLMKDEELSASLQDRMIVNFQPDLVETFHAGHLPMLTRPLELRNVLRAFLLQFVVYKKE